MTGFAMLRPRSNHEESGPHRGVRLLLLAMCSVGLTASAIYADGRNRIDDLTGSPLPDRNETNVRVDYAIGKGTFLEGLLATFRYSWLHQDGSPQTGTQLRAYLNYAVRF